MSFTYSGDPENNPIDYGRFMIGDTHELGHILEDAEIQYILDMNTGDDDVLNELTFRAAIFRQAATMFAIKATKRSLGPQSEETRDRLKYFRDEADKAEHACNFSGTPPTPNYAYPKVFNKHMMSYGGTTDV